MKASTGRYPSSGSTSSRGVGGGAPGVAVGAAVVAGFPGGSRVARTPGAVVAAGSACGVAAVRPSKTGRQDQGQVQRPGSSKREHRRRPYGPGVPAAGGPSVGAVSRGRRPPRPPAVDPPVDGHVLRPVGQSHPDHRQPPAPTSRSGPRPGRRHASGPRSVTGSPKPAATEATSEAWGVPNSVSKVRAPAHGRGKEGEDPATPVVGHHHRAGDRRHGLPTSAERRGGRPGRRRVPPWAEGRPGPPPAPSTPRRRCRWRHGWPPPVGDRPGGPEGLHVPDRHRRRHHQRRPVGERRHQVTGQGRLGPPAEPRTRRGGPGRRLRRPAPPSHPMSAGVALRPIGHRPAQGVGSAGTTVVATRSGSAHCHHGSTRIVSAPDRPPRPGRAVPPSTPTDPRAGAPPRGGGRRRTARTGGCRRRRRSPPRHRPEP